MLVDSVPLRSFSHAGTWLEELPRSLLLFHDPNEWEGYWMSEFHHLSMVRSAVWIALGEILRASRGADERITTQQPAISIPRMLKMMRLSRDSGADRIKGTLQYCEGMFDDQSASIYPEQIVALLSNGIEALTRRLWPAELSTGRADEGLAKVLFNHARSEDDREARFARIAKALYQNYRNPVQHDFDAFRCTLAEAAHFFYGVKSLLHLSEEILSSRSKQ